MLVEHQRSGFSFYSVWYYAMRLNIEGTVSTLLYFYVHRTGLLLLRASDGHHWLDDGVCICDAHV